MTDHNLTGKIAIVTGAGKGIGAACVHTLAEAGAKVIAVARTQNDLDQVKESYPEQIETWCMDVTDSTFLDKIEALNQLDILVNNAGTNQPEPLVNVQTETLDRILNLNVRSIFLASQSAAKAMIKKGNSGSIIQMSSQMGHVGSPNRTVYCMTKHAVEGLMKAMAVELAPHQIRVNSVAPTFIETPMTKPMFENPEFKAFVDRMIPLGKVGMPEDVANAVLYLASDAAQMITGHSLKIDGGWTAQ